MIYNQFVIFYSFKLIEFMISIDKSGNAILYDYPELQAELEITIPLSS